MQTQFGTGPLSRAAARVYGLLVVELLLLLCTAPGLVPLLLLERDARNLPLVALCLLPAGPALSASLYALHRHTGDLGDLHPALDFRRGYRLNAVGALWIWVPWLAGLTVIAINLANLGAAGVPGWWGWLLAGVAAGLTVWLAAALVITSLYAFRPRDVARLGAYFLVRRPGVTLAVGCLLVVAAGVVALTSEALLLLAGSLFALALLAATRPMRIEIEQEFIE